mmetsp:Transcript_139648/g.260399  ORF Transcript_139648/g.260399 Transcript_139648/m.260399 type:complete len:245 (-) Transcript_139648:191-925(-)
MRAFRASSVSSSSASKARSSSSPRTCSNCSFSLSFSLFFLFLLFQSPSSAFNVGGPISPSTISTLTASASACSASTTRPATPRRACHSESTYCSNGISVARKIPVAPPSNDALANLMCSSFAAPFCPFSCHSFAGTPKSSSASLRTSWANFVFRSARNASALSTLSFPCTRVMTFQRRTVSTNFRALKSRLPPTSARCSCCFKPAASAGFRSSLSLRRSVLRESRCSSSRTMEDPAPLTSVSAR